MGLVEAKQPCPFEGCHSSDAYHVYEDGDWCYSCGRGSSKQKSIKDCVSVTTTFRKVEDAVGLSLGFESLATKSDVKDVLYRKYVYPEGIKYRNVKAKKFWSEGTIPALGGTWLYNAGSSRTVCIVEGEEDAAAFKTACDLPVVWLTSAAIKTSERKEIYDYLEKFSKIVLCFENDEAGKKAKQVLGTMLGGKVYEASLTKYKDASDYVQNDAQQDLFYAVLNAKVFTADFVFNSDSDFEDILNDETTNAVIPTPFSKLNKLMPGLPLGHIVLLTGMEGLGKTEILRSFEYHQAKNYPQYPLSVTHHEESKKDTLKGFGSYHMGINTKDPENKITNEQVLGSLKEINSNNNLFITDIGEGNDVGDIMDRFKYLVTVLGVKVIYVDPINQFTPPDHGEANVTKFLDNLAQRMGKFVVEHQVCCVWTAHVNDEGKTRDSRMISKAASIRIDITRDLMAEEEEVRNTTTLSVTKNRPFAKTGVATSLLFDTKSFTLIEQDKELPF